MKRYKLKKDLPTFKVGKIFILDDGGNLYLQKETSPNFEGDIYEVMAYSNITIKKFQWFEEIPEEPKTMWDMGHGDDYYYISTHGDTQREIWTNHYLDEGRRASGNCFFTKEEAQKELTRRKAKQILLRDTKGFKPNYRNCNFGWQVYYDVMLNEPKLVAGWVEYADGTIRFATENDAEDSIKVHEKEWRTYLGVEE